MKQDMKILMIGDSLSKRGGIVSVQKLILSEMSSGVKFRHIATLVDGSSLQKIAAFLKALVKLFWTLLRHDIDLIHTHVSDGGSVFREATTTLVACLFRKPVVMHTHGPQFHLFFANLPSPIQQGLSWIFRQCAHFIVLSESWKTYYVESLGLEVERVTVLPNAVKIPLEIPTRIDLDPVYLLFLGKIGSRKGAFDLVQSFAALPVELRCRTKLILAGDGEVVQLRQLIETLHLNREVEVIDWVDAARRDALLQKASIFLLPSYNEGLPMSLLEAMSWGLPAITTPVGGIPEVVYSEENGLLIEPGNLEQLAAAMQRLIEDEPFRHSLGKVARASIAPFDIKRYVVRLEKIYRFCSVNPD